jgi:hypothetical protein
LTPAVEGSVCQALKPSLMGTTFVVDWVGSMYNTTAVQEPLVPPQL